MSWTALCVALNRAQRITLQSRSIPCYCGRASMPHWRKSGYVTERKFIQDLEQERQRSQSLLLNILPQIVVDRMRDGEKVIADRIIDATILFCDLVGFTALSQELSADRTIA